MSFSSPPLHFRSENLHLLSNVASQKVSEFNKEILQTHVDKFKGGRIKLFQKKWESLTSDREIISIVKHGLTINLSPEFRPNAPFECKLNKTNSSHMDLEINKLLKKGVITQTTNQEGDYFSNVFLTDKKRRGPSHDFKLENAK